MPSGPPELHEKWCNKGPFRGFGDSNAVRFLMERGIHSDRGVYRLPKTKRLTEEEGSALDYLCMEWDYAVERA